MRLNYNDNFSKAHLLGAVSYAGDGAEHDGTGVSLGNCRDGVAIVNVGTIPAATTITIQVQTSSDNSTWSDVLSADQDIATADGVGTYCYELANLKKYVRLQYKVTNGKTVVISASAIGWNNPDL